MMWPSRLPEQLRIKSELTAFNNNIMPLHGLTSQQATDVLAWQFVASLRREDYYKAVQAKPIGAARANPNGPSFDAERAVFYWIQNNNIDEAAWLIFLMAHFARPADTGWLRLKDVYGKLGDGIWDWPTVVSNPQAFANWLASNWQAVRGKYGSHRKYQSIRPDTNGNMGRVVADYVSWIGSQNHQTFYTNIVKQTGNNPHTIFEALYNDMKVFTFGRLAKFDYLSLIGRYNIAPIVAGSAFLKNATGPLAGTRLLFDGNRESNTGINSLQDQLDALDEVLDVGMTVMEDALCNWQKSPTVFEHFKG